MRRVRPARSRIALTVEIKISWKRSYIGSPNFRLLKLAHTAKLGSRSQSFVKISWARSSSWPALRPERRARAATALVT